MSTGSLNRVEIDLAALRHNLGVIRSRLAPTVRLMAVVKADAYGHGLVPVVRALAARGVDTFAVAEVEEGVRLREAGVTGEIVVLVGAVPEFFPDLVAHGLTPVLYEPGGLDRLSALAVAAGVTVKVHLKVDVGMGRFGIMPQEAAAFAAAVAGRPGLALAGVLSHLPMADGAGPETERQLAGFEAMLAGLGDPRSDAGHLRHIANSAALFRTPAAHFDMVRPGITLYGCAPVAGEAARLGLRPVMRFVSRVMELKEVPAGYGISYSHTFVTRRPSRLAVLPVGYDHGYLRRLSNRGAVLIRGQRAPLCGNVCMSACVVDVTDLAGVAVGDEVVLLGSQGGAGIDADEVAGWLDTISYEVLCLFGNCNQRVYVGESQT